MSIFDVLVRLAPTEFRARFEQSMRYALERETQAARARGRAVFTAFVLTTCIELLWLAVRERAGRRTPLRARLAIDWRDAWRAMRATPLVTAVAVLSLGLGIGANTALFTVLNSLALKPLPVHAPDRLAYIKDGGWTNPIWEALRDHHADLADGAFAWSAETFDTAKAGETMPADGVYASGSMFRVLGITPHIGRLFDEDDDRHGGGPSGAVAVISYRRWQQAYGSAPDIVGRTLHVERVPFTIIGVTPSGFFGPDVGRAADVMIPLGAEKLIKGEASSLAHRSSWWVQIMFRMRPDQTIEDLQARLHAIQPQVRQATLPPFRNPQDLEGYLSDPLTLESAVSGRSPLRGRYLQPLTIGLVVVGIVLLIACANIASLLLARAVARRHELSVRLALGASRARLARQLIAESVMLAFAGALCGLAFGSWGSRALVAQLTTWNYQAHLDLSFDWRVLGFTAAIALVTALLFGVAPALSLSGMAPNDALKEKGRGVAGDRALGFRSALVVLQVALSLTLVVAAGLFARTYLSLATRDRGFTHSDVLIVRADLQGARVAVENRVAAFKRLRDAAAAVPGVAMAAVSYTTPISNRGWNDLVLNRDGSRPANPRQRTTWVNLVTPGWFETFGLPLVEGRDVDARDTAGAPLVAVVTRSFARKYLQTEHPVGARFYLYDPERERVPYDVIGLVDDVVYRSLRSEMQPTIFRPLAQWDQAQTSVSISVRAASGPPAALSRALASAVLREQPQAKLSFTSLPEQIDASLTQERLVASLSGVFGALALVLAGLGIYGVAAYAVSRRRREIGIRMALGADSSSVVGLVLRRLGTLVLLGLLIGAGASLWAGKFIATLLYQLEPRDPVTLAGAAGVLAVVGLMAGWLPARRASRIDPTVVLRDS